MSSSQSKKTVQIGDQAPDFTLPTQKTGESFHLREMTGKFIVLYFYPKDDTKGCTDEACSFRDSYEIFQEAGAEVIGVSSDSEESHQRFASKYHLPFLLLSDKDGAVRKLFGVPTTMGILPGRVTYVIDTQGIVRHVFNDMFHAQRHITEALNTIKALDKA
jgi:thioredoxin-dependent peroxiredoxin